MTRNTKIKRGVILRCVFSADLFKFFREAILREIEVLLGLIIGGYNFSSIRYAYETVVMEDTERNPQKFLEKVVKKIGKKGLNKTNLKNDCLFGHCVS